MTEKKNSYDMVGFTAPSGAGKTTIVRHLVKKYPDHFLFSVSATTRAKRKNEKEGVDYFFMDNDSFIKKVENGDFVEWEEVYKGQYYGTLRSEVDRIVAKGKKVIFDIEINGAQSLKKAYGDRCLIIYVKPPSFNILVERLINRRSESAESLEHRINRIKTELLFEDSFDRVLLNNELDKTLYEAERIIEEDVLGTTKE